MLSTPRFDFRFDGIQFELMKSKSSDCTTLTLGSAFFLGIIVRFAPTLIAGFRLNDAGIFLNMIRDLSTSHYLLPQITSYNFAGIPYAYPPFGFYVARMLADIGFGEISILRFLPPLMSSIAIYGIYLFSTALLQSRERGVLTALIYALTPRAYTWLVMGGGLTRAFGFCFLVFTGWAVYSLFQKGTYKWLSLSILFSTLTVLSHPEATIHAVSLCILLWLFYGRTRQSAFHAVLIAFGTLIFSAPWWGTVLMYHGLDPFLSVINTGMHGASLYPRFWSAIYPKDSLLPILSILFLLAIIWGVFKKNYFLLLWVILPFIAGPRSALNVVVFPLSILSANVFWDMAAYALKQSGDVDFIKIANFNRLIFILVLYLFAESYLFGYRLVNNSLTMPDRDAMGWVRENIPTESRFVLLTGNPAPELDAFQEWFPTLAERQSITTFQGTEWTLGPHFFPRFRELKNLQACMSANCLQVWITNNNVPFDYILIRKVTIS